MDWAKAKTILIIVLLVFCIGLGSILVSQELRINKDIADGKAAAEEYLKALGVKINTEIPTDHPSLAVLFVEYSSANIPNGNLTYKDYEVFTNLDSSAGYTITAMGSDKARVNTASAALLDVASQVFDNLSDLTVDNIQLCYYINNDKDELMDGNRDTAIPAWKIETGMGRFFVYAY